MWYIDIPSPKLPWVNSWYLGGRRPGNYLVISVTNTVNAETQPSWSVCQSIQLSGSIIFGNKNMAKKSHALRDSQTVILKDHTGCWLLVHACMCMCIGVLSLKINKPWKKALRSLGCVWESSLIFRAAVQLQEAKSAKQGTFPTAHPAWKSNICGDNRLLFSP